MRLDGKTALVTGAGRRVGRAIAVELAAAGARVAVHFHRSAAEAEALAAQLPGAVAIGADLRDADASRRLVDEAAARLGSLELLVNSAADYLRRPLAEQEDAAFEGLLALNLVAPARLIRLALPVGLTAVVNLVDVAAWQAWRFHSAYGATKAALHQLTRNLALELAPTVRVNAVAPGAIAMPAGFPADEAARIERRIPLGRFGVPEDVARAVRFLCEEEYLTGVILPVDGGYQLR